MKSIAVKRRLISIIGISCLFGVILLSYLPPTASTAWADALTQESLQSTYSCENNTCVFHNVCVDNTSLLFFSEFQNETLPTLSLGANSLWGLRNKLRIQYMPLAAAKSNNYSKIPVFLMKMIAVGNFGHTILQNILPFLEIALRYPKTFDAKQYLQLISMNDCLNCGWPDEKCAGEGSFGYSNCDDMKDQLYPLIMNRPIIPINTLLNSSDIKCFHSAAVGVPENLDLLWSSYNASASKLLARQQMYHNLRFSLDYMPKEAPEIVVLVYCKTGGRHGGALANCDMVDSLVESNFQRMYKGMPIIVKQTNFETNHNISDQIRIVSEANVFIANGGGSSYYSLFLRNGAVSLILPQCQKCVCSDIFPYARIAPGITYIPISPNSIACPKDNCEGMCGGQSIPLVNDFTIDLEKSFEAAYQTIISTNAAEK